MKKKTKINFNSIFALICILSSTYLIHSIYLFSQIETFIRYFIITLIIIFDIFIIYKLFKKKKKKKKNVISLYGITLIIITLLYLILGINLNKIYSYFTGLNKNIIYSTSLVTLKETNDIDLITLKGAKIAILSDTTDDGYKLAQDIIKKENLNKNNEIIDYDNYTSMITALYNKEVDYIFLPTNYADIYSTTEGFENLSTTLKTITTTEKEITKEEASLLGSSKNISEPFTILLMGIDSTTEGLSKADSFNGDSLMLITFNPNTMSATMLSIPRDSYVPIACFKNKYENKITHSASRGTSCVINTVQNFLDIKIDYYMKINFTGVVDLVNALDGIEVDVPYSFCEQNSKREFGNNMVYVKKGYQTLNGEQALAFARNRKKNSEYCSKEWTEGLRDDFVRANNQQTVVQAILDKMKAFTDISKLDSILEVLSDNLDTNMSENTIFSFYNIAKDVMLSSSNDKVLSIQKLFIDGTGQYIYDENTKLQLWNYIPNKKSVDDVKNAMKINLGIKKYKMIKDFSFSLDEEYTPKTIGKGPYSTYTTYDLLIDLTKLKLVEAQNWASKNKITLEIEYTESSKHKDETIIEQNYPVNKRLDKIDNKTVKIKVVKNKKVDENEKIDCLENENNKICMLPDFVSKTKKDIETWGNKFTNTINFNFKYEEADKEKDGTIISQSVPSGTSVKEIINEKKTITIVIAKEKKKDEEEITDNNNDDNKNENMNDKDENNENKDSNQSSNENTNNNNDTEEDQKKDNNNNEETTNE